MSKQILWALVYAINTTTVSFGCEPCNAYYHHNYRKP